MIIINIIMNNKTIDYYPENHGYNCTVIGKEVWIDGVKLPSCPSKRVGTTVIQEYGHVYLNGYEWKNNKWRKTLKAFLKCLFF